jgi:hypothetical protein
VAWEEELFSVLDDLEQQAESLYAADRAAELADRSRAEYAAVPLAGRLMASVEHEVELTVLGRGRLSGTLQRVGDGWLLLHRTGQDWVVRLAAVLAVQGASARAVPEVAWSPLTRLGLGSALRRVADSGETCVAHLVDGTQHEVVLVRVGQDFAEARGVGGQELLVPFTALAAVQRRDG